MIGLLYAGKQRLSNQIVFGWICREDCPDYKSAQDWIDGIREIYSRCSEVYSIRLADRDDCMSELKRMFPDGILSES